MTPEEAAVASDRAIADIAGMFMLDLTTYERGAELGYPGASFYFVGRAGVLGDVSADVAAATFVFFNPATVRQAWADAAQAPPPSQAAVEFAACGHRWAEVHLPDDLAWDELAELCGTVISGANPAGAPLFAAWRGLPEPTSTKALALHRLNALRELRGGLHGAAVLAHGLDPAVAVAVKSPYMLPIFGWTPAPAVDSDAGARWQRAEDATNAMMAPHLGLLDDAPRDRLVTLATAAGAALGPH